MSYDIDQGIWSAQTPITVNNLNNKTASIAVDVLKQTSDGKTIIELLLQNTGAFARLLTENTELLEQLLEPSEFVAEALMSLVPNTNKTVLETLLESESGITAVTNILTVNPDIVTDLIRNNVDALSDILVTHEDFKQTLLDSLTDNDVKEALKNIGVGRETSEGGEIFNDYNGNKAVSEYSTASGTKTLAGLRGYYWVSLNAENNTITLSTNQHTEVDEFELLWEPGDVISIRNFHTPIIDAAVIKEITKNVIKVEELPFTERTDSTGLTVEVSDFGVWVLEKPEMGLVDLAPAARASGIEAMARGAASVAEGNKTTATDIGAHAEGYGTTASGSQSHAEGNSTKATASSSHAEGYNTEATGKMSHSEGSGTKASGQWSHAEGCANRAEGKASHAEGRNTIATSDYQHVQGVANVPDYKMDDEGNIVYDENGKPVPGNNFAEIVGGGTTEKRKNIYTLDWNGNARFEGDVEGIDGISLKGLRESIANVDAIKPGVKQKNSAGAVRGERFNSASNASGENSHAEGNLTDASGAAAHAEGYSTTASGIQSHAEGSSTIAKSSSAHAEGYGTTAAGSMSHAEGKETNASGTASHSEGNNTVAEGAQSHAEGNSTTAKGSSSHSEGYKTIANGKMAHAEGKGTIANGEDQHVQGRYNVADTEIDPTDTNGKRDGKYAHIVGNGVSDSKRSNAHTLDWQGNAWYAGGLDLDKPNADGVGRNVWTSRNVVDRLCPAFSAKGKVVSCEPVAGYPLQVVTQLPASEDGYTGITMHHFGENLLPKLEVGTTTQSGVTFVVASDGSITANGTATSDIFYKVGSPARDEGKTYTLIGCPPGGGYGKYFVYTSLGTEDEFAYDRGNGVTFTAPISGTYSYFIMIKTGVTVDGLVFRPALYLTEGGETLSVDFGKTVYGGSYNWNTGVLTDENEEEAQLNLQTINAFEGVNTLWVDVGTNTVTGKADPVAVINKLTNAIIALGGNI